MADDRRVQGNRDPLPISLKSVSVRAEKRPGYGILPSHKSLTRRMRNRLRRIGGVIDQDYRVSLKDVRSFSDLARIGRPKGIACTGTLPGSTDAAMIAIAEWSAYIVNRLMTWVGDQSNGKAEWFFVWEPQKRGALHIHIGIFAHDLETLDRIKAGFKPQWINILKDVSDLAGVDLFERSPDRGGGTWRDRPDKIQADCESIYGRLAGYVSKYCGKPGGEFLLSPSRVAGHSRKLGQRLKSRTRHFYTPMMSGKDVRDVLDLAVDYAHLNGHTVHHYRDRVGSGENWIVYSPNDDEHDHFEIMTLAIPRAVDRGEYGGEGSYSSINPDRLRQENAAREQDRMERDRAIFDAIESNTERQWWHRRESSAKRIAKLRQECGLDVPWL